MTAPASRRGFLRGLTTLPLIGGGVAIIGNPTAAAVPITGGTIATYIAWLDAERRYVQWVTGSRGFVPQMNPGAAFHGHERNIDIAARNAVERAPVVLSTVGCLLTCPEAETQAAEAGFNRWPEGGR